MNHNTIELPKSYYDNQKRYKTNKICHWKSIGVIYDDFDDLYEVYMNTMECQYCKKPFETSYDRCLDHNHETGLFRMILCQGCNNHDSHLKYPAGMTSKDKYKLIVKAYYNENRDKLLEQHKEYREANKEKIKEKYEANKEQINLQRKAKYQANKEQINLRRKAQRQAKKEKLKENNLNK